MEHSLIQPWESVVRGYRFYSKRDRFAFALSNAHFPFLGRCRPATESVTHHSLGFQRVSKVPGRYRYRPIACRPQQSPTSRHHRVMQH